jgi:hypothetical protein
MTLGVKICENSEFTFSKRKNTSLIQRRPVYLSEKSQKCDFCDFSLKYTGLLWIREVFFRFENVKFEILAYFYP